MEHYKQIIDSLQRHLTNATCDVTEVCRACLCRPLPAAVHHDGHQVVHAVGVGGVPRGVEEPQLQGEHHAVRQLGVAVQLVHVLEALQVQRQDHGQLLHPHPGGWG